MRLINIYTYQLKEFLDDSIPPYVVLSHTWGDNELVYQDMFSSPQAQDKQGFSKIEGCCKVAGDFRLEWAWIDTICIDKTSSAELSEAINSMFAWYQGAQICLAYLSDVEWKAPRHGNWRGNALQSFRRSRWFTRGWTLQELLAPSEVIFLDKNWVRFGTKDGFADVIESITSIRRVFLMFPNRLQDCSVAERLSWASKRRTSRKEDMAYCLLGLLGINMPLLYGEGDRAFVRLQHEIIQSTYDHTLLAWGLYSTSALQSGLLEEPPFLAPSPSAFENWSSSTKTLNQNDHYFFTNLGLHIDLLLIPLYRPDEKRNPTKQERQIAPALGLALLDCYQWSPSAKYRVALPLQLEDRGSAHVAPLAKRARAASPFLVPEYVGKLAERWPMYLQNASRAKNVSSKSVWCIGCSALFSKDYYIADYFPPTQVDVIHHHEEKGTTLCLVSEPDADCSLIRLRHDKYSTVLLLIRHTKTSAESEQGPGSSVDLPRDKSCLNSGNKTGGVWSSDSSYAQLWITSTDNLKTAFEMALQPSYSEIGFDYIINEFQWTSLGSIVTKSSASVSTWASASENSFRRGASLMKSASSSPFAPLMFAANRKAAGSQIKEIDPSVLEEIGALQVPDPVLFLNSEEDEHKQKIGSEIASRLELFGADHTYGGRGISNRGIVDVEKS